MNNKVEIKVKPITKKEAETLKFIKNMRLKMIIASFIAVIIVFTSVFVLMWKDYGFKLTHLSLLQIFLIIFTVIISTLVLSLFMICISCPKDSFLESKYHLICGKCRGRILKCEDGSYACYCGCDWSKEEVEQAVKEYKK